MALRASFERVLLDSPLPRSSHSINVVGSKAYLFGGELRPREPVDAAVHVFDLPNGFPPADGSPSSSNKSIQESTVSNEAIEAKDGNEGPPLRVGHTSARVNDDIYIFGGRGGKDMTALQEKGRLWRFSTKSSAWTAVDPASSNGDARFPEARSYHASTSAPELGKVFIHAGCPASGRTSDLWSFDIESRTWTKLPEAPEPPRGGPGLTYALGKLWRYGGFDGKNELGGQLDYIDVSGGDAATEWKSVKFSEGQYPGARSVTGLQVVHVKDKPYLVAYLGERDTSNLGHAGAGVFWGDIWSLALTKQGEIEADKWVKCEIENAENMPERGWFASDLVGKDKILVYGGLNARNERESDGILASFH
ncbi:kelch repeat protein [Cystobasidium minutum MCA 4210]|uniref:kelch repeat protein n=1 Tax=Cystobasidium minutum MCA 4210 TaxID=1397322 RepID=UPI0034CE7964|eukprot:jgi/Rhomi1/166279/fgenesh1_kg.1_\